MKLLLLVQTESDVQHLDAAAKAILNSSITGVWTVFSPAITVNSSEAAAKLDTEIEQLRAAEKQAADRSDYTAAAGYKTQREGKELDRAKAVRDAWKTAPEEARKAKTQAIFNPFLEPLKAAGLNVRVTGHSDHYEREQWVTMLNSLSGVWFKPFTPGSFIVGWPESVETSIKMASALPTPSRLPVVPATGKPISKEEMDEKLNGSTRRAELEATHHMSLRPLAKGLGIDVTGKKTEQIIDLILEAEAAGKTVAVDPALAEY